VQDFSDSEVSYADVTPIVHDQVLWLDVSVHNSVDVQVLEASDDAGYEEFCIFFVEALATAYMESKISSRHQVHSEVQVVSVLEGVLHIDNEGVLEHSQ
jgi:hypothetical protein